MAISTFDQYIAGSKQLLSFYRWAPITTIANAKYSSYQIAGDPGFGSLTGSNTTSGVLVTSSTAGFNSILTNPTGGAQYYLSRFMVNGTQAGLFTVQDLLYKAGTYPFNASQTLSSQPSIAGRIPSGSDYTCVDLYIECVTAFTGSATITINYTNQSGVTGRVSGNAIGTPTVGRLYRCVLQAGDSGFQEIDSVTCTGATAGTFNVLLVRDLYIGRLIGTNQLHSTGLEGLGFPEIFQTSALHLVVQPDATTSGAFGGYLEVVSG